VYTGYSIALRAFAALRCLRTQPFHDAQPLQVKNSGEEIVLTTPCDSLDYAPPKEMARDVFYPITGPSRPLTLLLAQ
jgi:hypothetical protein